MTGSGGVFRDIMGDGQGAKTIISTDMFCFAPPDLDVSMLPPGTLNPDYLQRRVVQVSVTMGIGWAYRQVTVQSIIMMISGQSLL